MLLHFFLVYQNVTYNFQQLHVKVGEMCREHRRRSPASEAGDTRTHSPDKVRARSPGNASTPCPGNTNRSPGRSRSPPSEMQPEVNTFKRLLEENERLKCQAREVFQSLYCQGLYYQIRHPRAMFQQEEQISSLASQQARLAAQLLSVQPTPMPVGPSKPVELMGPKRPMGLLGEPRPLELMGPKRPIGFMGPVGLMRPLEQLRPRTAPAALPGCNTHVLQYVHIYNYTGC